MYMGKAPVDGGGTVSLDRFPHLYGKAPDCRRLRPSFRRFPHVYKEDSFYKALP